MSRVDLLLKLSVDKDKRTNSGEVEQHSLKHALSVFSENLTKMLLMNLVYALIFALPFLFCVFILPGLANKYFFSFKDIFIGHIGKFTFEHFEYNFVGQLGIGYPGVVDSMTDGYERLYDYYFRFYIPVLSASIVPMVFGLSGLFHCMRGYMWGENVRPLKSYFRGIKKLWKPFLIVAFAFGAVMCGVLYGGFWHIKLMKIGAAMPGSWVLFVFLILFVWVIVAVLYFLLPMFACYRFPLKDALKNSSILFLILFPGALIAAAVTIGIFMLSSMGSVVNYIVAVAMLGLGFVVITGVWTSCAQKAFGNYILPQYESGQSGGKMKVEARVGVNPYKEAKAKMKAQEDSAIGQATRARAEESSFGSAAPAEKKKKVATKRVSYKRKK